MIYFVQAEETRLVKIGRCADGNLDERVKAMQTGCPHKLVVIGVVEEGGGKGVSEEGLHHHFAKLHVRGEWYQLSNDVLDFLNKEGKPFFRKKTAPIDVKLWVADWCWIAKSEVPKVRLSPNNAKRKGGTNQLFLLGIIGCIKHYSKFYNPSLLRFHIDSQFIGDSLRKHLYDYWAGRGWVYKNGNSVVNKELWQEIMVLSERTRTNITATGWWENDSSVYQVSDSEQSP